MVIGSFVPFVYSYLFIVYIIVFCVLATISFAHLTQNQDASQERKLDQFRHPKHPEHPENRGAAGDQTSSNTFSQVS